MIALFCGSLDDMDLMVAIKLTQVLEEARRKAAMLEKQTGEDRYGREMC